MPIYYKKVPQNDIEKGIDSKKFGRYYELSEMKFKSTASLLSIDEIYLENNIQLEKINTVYGEVFVGKQEFKPVKDQSLNEKKRLNSIIVSIHDIGLNHESNFLNFFDDSIVKKFLKNFTIFHINMPGQHKDSEQLPLNYCYPSMDQLAEIVDYITCYYEIDNFVGFGQGAGANILLRYVIKKPIKVNGLFLINPSFNKTSWYEWFYQKRNIKLLQSTENSLFLNQTVQDYFNWYQFGKTYIEREEKALEIIEKYKNYYSSESFESVNLSLFIDSYIRRDQINILRNTIDTKKKVLCDCVILAGNLSFNLNDSLTIYSRLSPEKSNWIKFDNCGNPLLEKKEKVFEALKLFLLGLGYTIKCFDSYKSKMRKSLTTLPNTIDEENNYLIDF